MIQTIANWVQIISGVSLPVALWAIWAAKRDLARERRTGHELEVLRTCAALLHETHDSAWYGRMRTHLLLIPGTRDMPLLRAAIGARPTPDALAAFARKYPDRPPLPDPLPNEPDEVRYRVGAIAIGDQEKEIQTAINRRVDG